jgi:hypothetical protein
MSGLREKFSNLWLRITMPDGSKYDVPVMAVAMNRARYYAKDFEGSVERSLDADTLRCFDGDGYEIIDWAANNMDWKDVADVAVRVEGPKVDFQEGWANGEKEIVEKPPQSPPSTAK